MPTKAEWEKVHAELMAKLRLPCKLRFIEDGIGRHIEEDSDECFIGVNLSVDFHGPEHLILHEAAHCRANMYDQYHGHDEHWAHILCEFYKATGYALPLSTAFGQFAKAAGIRHRSPDEAVNGFAVQYAVEPPSASYPSETRIRLRQGPGFV